MSNRRRTGRDRPAGMWNVTAPKEPVPIKRRGERPRDFYDRQHLRDHARAAAQAMADQVKAAQKRRRRRASQGAEGA